MSLSSFRNEFDRLVTGFLWRQWSQLGVAGARDRDDVWAQDPEALLAATFELARTDARLFDEVADWLVLNEDRLSLQRFNNALADGAGGSVRIAATVCVALGREAPGFRWRGRTNQARVPQSEALFDTPAARKATARDKAFLDAGYIRGPLRLSGKSREPLLATPITFAFRLREVFGVTARAEAVRVMLLHPGSEQGTSEVARACLFAKRNIAQALSGLAAAGVVTVRSQGRSDRWTIDRKRWLRFLDVASDAAPRWVDWPALLRGLVGLSRWLRGRDWAQLPPYTQASEARRILGEVAADLAAAVPGWRVPDGRRFLGEDYLPEALGAFREVLSLLEGTNGA